MLWKSPTSDVPARPGSLGILPRTGAWALLLAGAAYQPTTLAANDYNSTCSSCHGPLASSARKGRSASQIRAAINANRGGMGELRGISNADLNDIARELGGAADLPEPAPSPSAQPNPSPSAQPNPSPSAQPNPSPSAQPSPSASAEPSPSPSGAPNPSPSSSPTPSPPPGSCNDSGGESKPVVNAIADQDASVGQVLSFKVTALDCNDDPIIIKASKLKGGSMPREGQDYDDSGLWSGSYSFIPNASQANKSFVVKFTAVETDAEKKSSSPRQVRIRVFPAGTTFDNGAIADVKVQSARWSGDRLLVKGKVLFSKALNAGERSSVAASSQLLLTDGSGATEYASASVKANGQWSVQATLSESDVPCEVMGTFDGKSGTPRTVKKAPGCSP